MNKFKKVVCIAMSTFLLIPSIGIASKEGKSYSIENQKYKGIGITNVELQNNIDILDKYVVKDEDGAYFNIEKAIEDNASEDILKLGNDFNILYEQYKNEGSEYLRFISIPFYGNWCGPGHSGPAAPIDLLDSYCRTHDICYDRNGYWNCQCDIDLVKSINNNYHRLSATAKSKATDIVYIMKNFVMSQVCLDKGGL